MIATVVPVCFDRCVFVRVCMKIMLVLFCSGREFWELSLFDADMALLPSLLLFGGGGVMFARTVQWESLTVSNRRASFLYTMYGVRCSGEFFGYVVKILHIFLTYIPLFLY